MFSGMMPLLTFCLGYDVDNAVDQMDVISISSEKADAEASTANPTAADSSSHEISSSSSSSSSGLLTTGEEKTVELLNSHMSSIQLALEILTNLCSEEISEEESADKWDNVNEDMVEEVDNEVEDMIDEEQDQDQDMEMYNPEDKDLFDTMQQESSASLSSSSMEEAENISRFGYIISNDLLSKALRLAGTKSPRAAPLSSPASQPVIEYILAPFKTALSTVRLRAFGCLSNMLSLCAAACSSSSSQSNTQGALGWYQNESLKVWNWLFEVAHTAAAAIATNAAGGDGGQDQVELVEAAVSAMWSLARGIDALKNPSLRIVSCMMI